MIVVWRVVDSCNLSCPFCAFDKRLAFPRRHSDPRDVLRFARVLAEYQAQTGERVLLSWLGGEPLRWEPLAGLTHDVRALGLDVSATTNGSTLGSPKVRRHICDEYKELTVSIDGFAGFHDAMRGWAGAFERLRSWVPTLVREARARGSDLKLRANIVLMRQNVMDFAPLCLELAGWGITEITFNQLGGRDRPEFYPAHRLTQADVNSLEEQVPKVVLQLRDRGAMLIGGEGYLARIRASALSERMPIDDCEPGERYLFVDEGGRISPCSFTTSDYAVDVRTIVTAADVVSLPNIFRQMRKASRSDQCDDCLSTQVCGKFKRSNLSARSSLT